MTEEFPKIEGCSRVQAGLVRFGGFNTERPTSLTFVSSKSSDTISTEVDEFQNPHASPSCRLIYWWHSCREFAAPEAPTFFLFSTKSFTVFHNLQAALSLSVIVSQFCFNPFGAANSSKSNEQATKVGIMPGFADSFWSGDYSQGRLLGC